MYVYIIFKQNFYYSAADQGIMNYPAMAQIHM